MNTVMLIGRLARDPEMKVTPSGKCVCRITVAVDRGYGEDKQTDWVPVTLWEKGAEFAANYLAKGRQVAIEGRIQTRDYEHEGQKRRDVSVTAHRIQALGPRPAEAGGPAQPPAPSAAAPAPTQGSPAQHDPNDPFEDQ